MRFISFSVLALMALAGCGGSGGANDPARVVAQCVACHSFKKDAPKQAGPNLHGIMGQQAASRADFAYSSALKNSGITWTAETLDAYIATPRKLVPGTRMSFAGEPDPARRMAIIAYIEAVSAE